MAYAGALFADACLRGLNGEANVVEPSFVQSSVVPELPFFASKVRLGPYGTFLTLAPKKNCAQAAVASERMVQDIPVLPSSR
jgi:hypothetical protein